MGQGQLGAQGVRCVAGLRKSCFSGDKARCCSNHKDALSSEVLSKITRVSEGNKTGATRRLILLYSWAKYPISTVC